jgi:cation transport ATPase
MKTKLAALGILFSLVAGPAWAQAREVKVGVKGMVCAFCAQGIEKKFHAQPAVDHVDVNLGQKQVKLTLKDGQNISDDTIKSVLTESGYNVDKIERN